MNNFEAWQYLSTQELIRAAALKFVQVFELDDNEFDALRYKFRNLKPTRDSSRKAKKMEEWEAEIFYTFPSIHPPKQQILEEKLIIESDLSMEIIKPLSLLTLKALRTRLGPVLKIIHAFSLKEEVDSNIIAAYALMLLANESRDVNTANVCKGIIATGTYANLSKTLPIDKSTFLLDILEIGKRKYTNFRRLCKSENITFPSYS